MKLARLQVTGVRNLQNIDIRLSPAINLIQGPNASGKSSLLEALHILSCGKSFRTRHLGHVLNRDAASMTISAEIASPEHGSISMGMAYDRDRPRLRLRAAGRPAARLSELASILPLVALHQDSHRVFTEGPEYRRRFVDWGLFHVEQAFLPAWQRYRRALKQRNRILYHGDDQPQIWDAELAETAVVINQLRTRYLNELLPIFHELAALLEIPEPVAMDYRPGWDSDADYREMLRQSLRGDQAAGYTRFGPHRADIEFTLHDAALSEGLSRGQIKVLVFALYLALVLSYNKSTGKNSLLLLDDLTAELDDNHIQRLLDKIRDLELQVLITSSESRLTSQLQDQYRDYKVFHVEHGDLVEMI